MKNKLGPDNKTECGPIIEKVGLKRGVIHRDYIAHCLRWNFILGQIKRGMSIIDVGCGSIPLLKALYSMKLKPFIYVGVDVRKSCIDELMAFKTNFPKIGYLTDVRINPLPTLGQLILNRDALDFDVAVCLEVVEHFENKYVDHVLSEIRKVLVPGGTLYLSTPNYDHVHQAKHHVYEFTAQELMDHILRYFRIERMIGTFASQKDIIPVLTDPEKEVFDMYKEFWSSDLLSVIFASQHPFESRNILYVCRKE
jgi:2-polyprenyl-3-methyl-5-hydroxy-6-metoxy-1,4-benzoquinol methylase